MTEKKKIKLATKIIKADNCIIKCNKCPFNHYYHPNMKSSECARAYLKTLL